jgi:phosphate-selective porin OprO/OprP
MFYNNKSKNRKFEKQIPCTHSPSGKERTMRMNYRTISAIRAGVTAVLFTFSITSQGAADANQTAVSPGKSGFSLKWPDGNEVRIGAFVQSVGYFGVADDDNVYTSQFILRRARIDSRLKIGTYIDGRLHGEFAGTPKILDAYLQLNFFDPLAIRFGQFKSPVSQERLQSTPQLPFDDIGYTASMAPNRDIGIQVSGSLLKKTFAYQVAVLNGAQDGSSSTEDIGDSKEVAGRLVIAPFAPRKDFILQTLAVGLGGSWGEHEKEAPGSIRTPGRTKVFSYKTTVTDNGTVFRVAPGASVFADRVALIGEYLISAHEIEDSSGNSKKISNSAWDVSAGIALFGGRRTLKGFKVSSPLDLKSGSAGALELVLRAQGFNIDTKAFDVFAQKTKSVSSVVTTDAGLNWYPADYARLLLAYSYSRFVNGSASGDRLPEHIVTFTSNLTF